MILAGEDPEDDLKFFNKIVRKESHLYYSTIQWNPVNPTTNGPSKSGRINGVVVLKGFLNKKMTDRTLVQDKRKWLY